MRRPPKINSRIWIPTFTEVGVRITDIYGKPIDMFIVRPKGATFKINPLRWYNGHPGEHTINYYVESKNGTDSVEWIGEEYGAKLGRGMSDCTLWAECTTPDKKVFSTQKVRLVVVEDYVGNQYA